MASTEGPSRRFSAFLPSELDRAIALAGELMRMREEQDVDAALDEAERRAETEDVQLVRHAVEMFIVHDPEAARLAIPPIAPRRRSAPPPSSRARSGARRRSTGSARTRWPTTTTATGTSSIPRAGGRARAGRGCRTARASCSSTCTSRCWPATTPSGARSASGRSSRSPTTATPIGEGYEDRPEGTALRDVDRPDTGELTVAELEQQRDRLLDAVTAGAVQNGGGPLPLTDELLGALEEPTAGTLWGDVWHHGYGHVITAFVMAPHGGGDPGDIGDTATAIRDPFFWRWHRHVDDLNFALQEQAEPFAFDDAPDVALTAVELALEADPATPVDELHTLVAETDGVEHGDHEPFLWRLRADNPGAAERRSRCGSSSPPPRRPRTAARGSRWTSSSTRCAPGANEIERPGRLASPARKPAERPPVWTQGPAQTPHEQYCRCGWPYHLLLPRGTVGGMPFRVLAMLTDWELDRVSGDDECGSMSFCGARDRYPDRREMGYPFSRPLPGGVAATLEALPSVHARDLTIRHDPRPPA